MVVDEDGSALEQVWEDKNGRGETMVHEQRFPVSNLGGIGNAKEYLSVMTASIADRRKRVMLSMGKEVLRRIRAGKAPEPER